ncbi:cisplatin damage response ATP-dependent DNA ligase [Acuticoccus sp. I52.16.1]|uniref:cisplatin damage response ATP-dependent DNA ligase n=1 Tax=Acuticoccus sp. I52.16.1 TaxID=2928472 RepID=UPI001FD3F534|nr:cisplatin damage response ATP-dependent DNA ligase [Acuticoccus sp. I52.16.1]UOM32857.1 cisplatin damage response ATP-dependent DNA ligase [Acuticoccus sp. I52.16.1]
MQAFAHLLDRLSYEPRRNGKIALMEAYFRATPDPERGYALAALTDALSFQNAKPGLIRALIAERTDPVLFALSRDYVGDLSETVALMWPRRPPAGSSVLIGHDNPPESPRLSAVVETLTTGGKAALPGQLAQWLDHLDEKGRWALLKLITGSLRVGVSARLAKTAVARLGAVEVNAVEEVWHGLSLPYRPLFDWLEGRAPAPSNVDPAPFRPPMLANPTDLDELTRTLDPAEFRAEWKWDGIRIQVAAGRDDSGRRVARLYSRSGEDLSATFPDVIDAVDFEGALDGELLIARDGAVQSFNVLQQRLNRKTVSAKMLREFPPLVRCYDILAEGTEDLRALPFDERRARLEAFVAGLGPTFDLSPQVRFVTWQDVAAARADPASAGAGEAAAAVEGVMLKRGDSPYVPGRPKGPWFKWKRDPHVVDAVLMYAQRGSGKRSSFYSDYTFGVWVDGDEGAALVPVGKAYFGFTDEELKEIDKFVRNNTINRFGPVREVVHTPDSGLVLEVAFEGLNRSTRHKSGVAMRFPRISRLRWDKPPAEADRIETLTRLLAQDEAAGG